MVGLGFIFPNFSEKWISNNWTDEETGLGVGWPLKALKAIFTACTKSLSVVKHFWPFLLLPVVIIFILKFVSPQLDKNTYRRLMNNNV